MVCYEIWTEVFQDQANAYENAYAEQFDFFSILYFTDK